jgi:hypothetical protein
MAKTKESIRFILGEDQHAKAPRNGGRWSRIIALLVGLVVCSCLRIFLSSPQEGKSKEFLPNISSQAFAREEDELDNVTSMGNGSGMAIYATDDDDDDDDDMKTKLVPSNATRRSQRVLNYPTRNKRVPGLETIGFLQRVGGSSLPRSF